MSSEHFVCLPNGNGFYWLRRDTITAVWDATRDGGKLAEGFCMVRADGVERPVSLSVEQALEEIGLQGVCS